LETKILKFALKKLGHCFRARIVAMIAKFPGIFGFSSFYPIVLAGSDAIIVPD